jgi:phosphoribosylglycinamide formyltransferase-1
VEGRLRGAELALVISNNSKAGALEYARKQGIRAEHRSVLQYGGNADRYNAELLSMMQESGIEVVALAGYLKKLPEEFIETFENRILNVHPALLPSFGGSGMYGARVHEAVLARGCKVSGATVHFVSNDYDAGPIVLQKCCPVSENDTLETLERRVREIEYEIFPKAIGLLANDKLIVKDHRVTILP